jgi:DNA (cytosine-5)-methyltransferase 1
MKVYYNELDAPTAGWLSNIIKAGHLKGDFVDGRDIRTVTGADLADYGRAHFFAGIGGWELALSIAGWPPDWEVWTGSCPCQPFSLAGKQKQTADERDLWPDFFRLISERRPSAVFGEQVDNKHGRKWLARLRADLEGIGYAVGDASLNSAGVGAFQVRQRLYWVADAAGERGRRRSEMAQPGGAKLGGSSKNLLLGPRPDHRGSSSALAVSDVCSPSHGIPARVGRLRGYGNAIDPEVAAGFVKAFLSAVPA